MEADSSLPERRSRSPAEVEDAVSVTVQLRRTGRSGRSSLAAAPGIGAEHRAPSLGADGHIAVEPDPLVYTLRALDGLRTSRWQTFGRLPQANIRAIFFSRLATAIDRGEPPDVTATTGLPYRRSSKPPTDRASRGWRQPGRTPAGGPG